MLHCSDIGPSLTSVPALASKRSGTTHEEPFSYNGEGAAAGARRPAVVGGSCVAEARRPDADGQEAEGSPEAGQAGPGAGIPASAPCTRQLHERTFQQPGRNPELQALYPARLGSPPDAARGYAARMRAIRRRLRRRHGDEHIGRRARLPRPLPGAVRHVELRSLLELASQCGPKARLRRTRVDRSAYPSRHGNRQGQPRSHIRCRNFGRRGGGGDPGFGLPRAVRRSRSPLRTRPRRYHHVERSNLRDAKG